MSFVASNIGFLRRQLGLSQQEFADKLAIKRSLLGAYEESRATPRYDVLEKISQLSGQTVSDVLNKNLIPEGYQPPSKRGRKATEARPNPVMASYVPSQPAHSQPIAVPSTDAAYPATLTLTVDTKGTPLASLVVQTELDTYGGASHQASYIASLPTISIPFLDKGQPYRAFELTPGQIHIGRLVRNWGSISFATGGNFILVYQKRVLLAHPQFGSQGLAWELEEKYNPPSTEPLEIWQSDWVLTNKWQPLPDQLSIISERLAALELRL
jgi:transcriptional regulator with XRE-family HTH domain